MEGLDALPHGIIGLKQSLEPSFPWYGWLLVLLVGCLVVGAFFLFRRFRKKQPSVLSSLRSSLSSLVLDQQFTPKYSSLLRSGIYEKFGVDIKHLLADDLAKDEKLFSAGNIDRRELEKILRLLERELYLGLELSEEEKVASLQTALQWFSEEKS
jgi:hypothetical protein